MGGAPTSEDRRGKVGEAHEQSETGCLRLLNKRSEEMQNHTAKLHVDMIDLLTVRIAHP